MKFEPKYKKLIWGIALVVLISLFFTGIIVTRLIKETNNRIETHWFFAESVRTGQPVVLKDAYIISNEEGVLKFIYDYQTYEVEGSLSEPYMGVANIMIKGANIEKISVKPDFIEDTLMSYTENTVGLKESGRNCHTRTRKTEELTD